MNTNLTSLRNLVALGLAATLTLAACGGDDDAGPAPTTDEPAAAEPADEPADDAAAVPTQPASIAIDAQESDGTSIIVATIELPAPGFVAVHSDADGSPGPVIGVSDLLPAGTSTDITVALSEPLAATAGVFPMVHIDTDGNGIYEFGAVEGVDGPGVTADGDVAVVPGEITVAGAGGDENTSQAEITIADFAFDGVAEVAVGTTVVVTNDDGSSHTWTAVDGSFDSGALAPGDSFEFTFTETGEFEYFCNFHPSMTGTIVVTG